MNKLLLSACVAALACGTANADPIFDSQALTAADCCDYITTPETRDSGFNYAAVLQFSQNVTVNQIGVFTSVDNAQDIKFLIFDSEFNGGTGNLLFSQTKSFAANGVAQFIYSDALSFTFLAGHTYDVGILGSTGTLTGFWSAPDNLTENGITEISANANFTDYNSPFTGQYSGVTPFIQLNTSGAVPEPASWAMMLGGFGLVGGALRSRRKAAVTFA